MRRLLAALGVLLAGLTIVWAATTEPRTGLSIPQRGDVNWDAQVRAWFTKIGTYGGFTDLTATWTAEQTFSGNTIAGTAPTTAAQLSVQSADLTEHTFSVWNNSGGGMKQVFIVENNGDGGLNGTPTDVNLRNAILNMGDTTASNSGAVPMIFQSPLGTSTLNLIAIMKVGDGPSGAAVFTVNSLGVLSLRNRGIASTVMNVCANSDTSCSTPVWRMSEDGTQSFGSGSGAPDTQLARISADVLGTPDSFRVAAFDRNVPQAVTVADNGAGTPATATLTPTASYINLTCSDANGCDITMSETSMVDGTPVEITNVSANVCNFADTPNVSELAGVFNAGIWDVLSLRYNTDRWVEVGRSNN